MIFVEILKAIIFGIVEGITEWLPVSSTGHLILFDELLRLDVGVNDTAFQEQFVEMFNVVIQLGAILAVVVLFFGKLNPISKSKTTEEKKQTLTLWLKVIIASVPAAIVGLVFDKVLQELSGKDIDGWLYNSYVVAAALIIYGILFIIIERFNKSREVRVSALSDISYKSALLIGVFQMLAIIPGTSRSGSTILGSMLIGVSRPVAAEFSFFMAIPAMLGASFIKLIGFLEYTSAAAVAIPLDAWVVLLVGCAVAFAVSMAAIKFLMDFVRRHSFAPFGVYRIALGILVLGYFLFV